MLFSCSKEQPLIPVSSSQQAQPDMVKASTSSDHDTSKTGDGNSTKNDGNDDITDPEKEEKEKTNKKAKN